MSISKKTTTIMNTKDDFDIEEDPYLIELHKRLADMKKERVEADNQTNLLQNRVKLLKREEDKSLKQVGDIEVKYKKKISLMQEIENDLKRKVELKALKENEAIKQKDANKKMKVDINDKIKTSRDKKLKEFVDEMNKVKEGKKQNEDLLRYIKEEERNTNKNKYEFIKNQKMLSEEKKKAQIIAKRNSNKKKLKDKLQNEKDKKEQAEKKNEKMGEKEVEILKRIKTTTKEHETCKYYMNKLNFLQFS